MPYELAHGQDLPPYGPISPWLTLVTSQFIHGGFLHIAGNMVFLWVFGDNVEDRLGHVGYLVFYLVAGVAAGLTQVYIDRSSLDPAIGASGAIAGVLGAYLVFYPRSRVKTLLLFYFYVRVLPVPAILLIGIWGCSRCSAGSPRWLRAAPSAEGSRTGRTLGGSRSASSRQCGCAC